MNYARMNALYSGSLRIENRISILRNLTFYKWFGTKVGHCIVFSRSIILVSVFVCVCVCACFVLDFSEIYQRYYITT